MTLAVAEKWGKCVQCGVEALLGDGLCVGCWDGKPCRIPLRSQPIRHKREVGKYRVLCKLCGSSSVVKYGYKDDLVSQYWFCKHCCRKFVINGALPGMRYQEYIVEDARRMYRGDSSYSKVRQELYNKYKVNVSASTLFGWFRNIPLVSKEKHCRKMQDKLMQRLVESLGTETIYTGRHILTVCGYSPQTKIEHTQLFKQGLISQVKGGWQVKESLYS